jgi:TetR/AcrR family transcriptional regulator of autoinduction and epiphytic fitness
MSSQPAPTRLTDRKREAILDAAVAEFRSAGYEATSMDRVAERASVSKRTVYNHFPSKEALFAKILERLWEHSVEGNERVYSADRPLRAQLIDVVMQKLRTLEDPNFLDLARVAIAAGIHSPERAREMVARMNEREEGLTVWIRAAIADGRLKTKDAVFAATQMHGLVKSFAFWPQISMGQLPLTPAEQKKVAEGAVDMFLACYGA